MSINIDIESIRKNLTEKKRDIEEKLKALDVVEKLSSEASIVPPKNIQAKESVKTGEYTHMTIAKACEAFFADSSDKKFTIADTMEALQNGGLENVSTNLRGTVNATLSRLFKRGFLEKEESGNKTYYYLKNGD